MAKKSDGSRSFLRLLFWEALALAGFLHLRSHPLANEFWQWWFHYGALVFLTAYPLLFVYRWKAVGGCLGAVLWPLSYLLSFGLGVSCYLGSAYTLLFLGHPFSYSLMDHWFVLGLLFAFLYFPILQPLLGVTREYQPLKSLLGILSAALLGGFLGYVLGWVLSQRLDAVRSDHSHWFLLWLSCILVGGALGAWIARRRGNR